MITPIQYLRGIAALMVVWVHSAPLIPAVAERMGNPQWGTAGVDLFFVISGFIMVVSTAGKPLTPWQFFENRLIRIAPLYWLVTGVMIAKAVSRHQTAELHYTIATIGQSLAFLPYHSLEHPGRIWPILLQGWTLNYEMFFYALFALSFVLAKQWRVPVLVGALAVLVSIGRAGPFSSAAAVTYTDPRLLEFGAGMVIAGFWLRQQAHVYTAQVGTGTLMLKETGPRVPMTATYRGVAMKEVAAGKISVGVRAVAIGFGFYFLTFLGSPGMMLVGASAVVVGSLGIEFRSRLLLELGNASYSIYLTHIFMFGVIRALGRHLPAHVSLPVAVAFMAVALTICAAAGWLCYRFVEKPLTDFLHGRVKQRARLVGQRRLAEATL